MKKLKLNQQELIDLRELVTQQVEANKNNPTSWYWLSLGQRIHTKIQE